jgi:hypothetical protein
MRSLHAAFLVVLVLAPFAASAQDSSTQITYTFENPQLQPAGYTILIREDGSGHFRSIAGPASTQASNDDIAPGALDRDIRIDDPLRAQLFRYARSHHFFAEKCDHGAKNIAFTGKKTLSWSSPDAHGSCTFDWASDPVLQHISDQLISTAFTLEEGRRLDVELKHSRLGLDAELSTLQDAAKDQRAVGLNNIAPELEAIAQDEEIMQRARARAIMLLRMASTPESRH